MRARCIDLGAQRSALNDGASPMVDILHDREHGWISRTTTKYAAGREERSEANDSISIAIQQSSYYSWLRLQRRRIHIAKVTEKQTPMQCRHAPSVRPNPWVAIGPCQCICSKIYDDDPIVQT